MMKTVEFDKNLPEKVVDVYKQNDGYSVLSNHFTVLRSTILHIQNIIKKHKETHCV